MNERTTSSLGLLVALTVLATGFTIAGIYGGRTIPDLLQVTARGVVPPGFVAILGKQQSYTVWLAVDADEEEVSNPVGHIDFLPPSAELKIVDLSTGNAIDLVSTTPFRRLAGGETTVSLWEFQSERPGQQIQVQASGFADSATMSVMPTNLGNVLRVSISLIAITVVTIALALAVLYRISKGNRQSSVADE